MAGVVVDVQRWLKQRDELRLENPRTCFDCPRQTEVLHLPLGEGAVLRRRKRALFATGEGRQLELLAKECGEGKSEGRRADVAAQMIADHPGPEALAGGFARG